MYSEFASIYDSYISNHKDDIAYWKEKALISNSKILELGIGTGRVAIELAKEGHYIFGIDSSLQMLKILKQKVARLNLGNNIEYTHLNMAGIDKLKITKKFDLIISCCGSFGHILKKEDQIKCLVGAKEKLQEKGSIILDFVMPPKIWNEDFKEKTTIKEFILPQNIIAKRQLYHQVNSDKGIFQLIIKLVYEQDNITAKKKFIITSKIVKPQDIREIAIKSGLKIKNIYGDYKKSKFSKNSHWMVVEMGLNT